MQEGPAILHASSVYSQNSGVILFGGMGNMYFLPLQEFTLTQVLFSGTLSGNKYYTLQREYTNIYITTL